MATRPPGGSPFGVTFVQVFPSSRDTWNGPSFDPVHITPFCTGDSRIEYNVAYTSSPVMSRVIGSPLTALRSFGSLAVRSGLIAVHVTPSSRVRCTTWDP